MGTDLLTTAAATATAATATGPGPAVTAVLLAGLAALLAVPRASRPVPAVGDRPGRVTSSAGAPRTGRERRSGGGRTVAAGVVAGAGAALLVGGWPGMAGGAVVALVVARLVARAEPAAVRRRRASIEAALPAAVDLLAACLRAGQAPSTALAAVSEALPEGPLREELDAVRAVLRLGGDPVDVWWSLGRHPQLGVVGRTVGRALDGGSSVADAMGRVAEELRRDRRGHVEARARAVAARAAVPLGVCLLPAFVLVGVVPLGVTSMSSLLQR